MALGERLSRDIKAALLGGNRFEGEVLRNLKAALLDQAVATGKRDTGLSDDEVQAVIAREVKKRRESVALYTANGRPELAQAEQDEIAVLERYLPQQLSDDELRQAVDAAIAKLGATGPQQMGQVIGAVKAQHGTAVDGARLADIVKQTLTT